MPVYTTLNRIRSSLFGTDGWKKLLRSLDKTKPDDEPLPLVTILDSNGFDVALRCLSAVEGHDKEIRLFSVEIAREVQHLMRDPRSVEALDVAERYAHGNATKEELESAYDAADDAADAAAYAAYAAADDAADAAAYAAHAAAEAAADAADAAAYDAAYAAYAAAHAAGHAADYAAYAAAAYVAYDAYADAYDAARKKQAEIFRRIFGAPTTMDNTPTTAPTIDPTRYAPRHKSTGTPLQIGDVVWHTHKPHVVTSFDTRSAYIQAMDDRKELIHVSLERIKVECKPVEDKEIK
jgi:hypothetical protein